MHKSTTICVCGSPLTLTKVNACYEDTNEIECDECSVTVKNNQKVYHCKNKKIAKHCEGFDLCTKCVLHPKAQCICGCKLLLCEAKTCYDNSNEIECDKCEKVIKGSKKVYHCPNTKSKKHTDGYDLCKKCAIALQKQRSKSIQTTSLAMDRNEFLVSGFIRSIQLLLKHKDKIIPAVIYEICYQFFMSAVIPCFYINDYQNKKPIQFGVLDIGSRKCTMIVTKHKNKKKQSIPYYRAQSFCKIPNIEKSNGIVTCVYDSSQNKSNTSHSGPEVRHESYPYLFVYDLSFMDNKINVKYEMKSQKSIPCLPKTWLSCGNNSVLYEYNGKLFKHDFKDKFADFKVMKQNRQKFQLKNTTRRAQWLNMTYLSRNNLIFCVRNHGDGPVVLKKLKRPTMREYSIKCGVFNMNNKKWIGVNPLKGKTMWNGEAFESICCYESNAIFIANSLNHTAKYDMNKQIWSDKYDMKSGDGFLGSRNSVMWLEDGNILNLLGSYGIRHKQSKLVWKCIDLREKTKSVVERTENIEGLVDCGNAQISLFQ